VPDPADAIQRVVREDWARMLAPLVRLLGDVGLAEDCLQDALVVALDRWRGDGVPREPRAWLIASARNRGIDLIRREQSRAVKEQEAVMHADDPDPLAEVHDPVAVADDVLRLVFLCCHPALAPETQTALSLRLLGGLTTAEIARAYLVSEPTMTKRLTRARQKIARATIPFELPPADQLPRRVDAVVATIYLMFNEGYAASGGDLLVRAPLIDEAIRLGELVRELLPGHPSVLGLLGLMLLQDSRRDARVGPRGELRLLREQDRGLWDAERARRGIDLVGAGLAQSPEQPNPYVVQGAIAACHALSLGYEETNWPAIVSWYDVLLTVHDTPVVRLNRAAAISEASGAQAGLDELEAVDGLAGYPLWHAARAELLVRLGRDAEAADGLRAALELETPGPLRDHLTLRLSELAPS
jgi:RNA polymerase sigma factor (sigma-70 family)